LKGTDTGIWQYPAKNVEVPSDIDILGMMPQPELVPYLGRT
jgi:hypothetical protein